MSTLQQHEDDVAAELRMLRQHLDVLERDLQLGQIRTARASVEDLACDVACLRPKLDALAAARSADFWARRRSTSAAASARDGSSPAASAGDPDGVAGRMA